VPKFSIDHSSAEAPNEVYQKVKSFFESAEDIRRIDPKISFQFEDAKLNGRATGSQFKADIQVSPEATGSKIVITVDLPFLLTPFKGKVQEIIQKKLAKHIG
jgi:hypothetical protein